MNREKILIFLCIIAALCNSVDLLNFVKHFVPLNKYWSEFLWFYNYNTISHFLINFIYLCAAIAWFRHTRKNSTYTTYYLSFKSLIAILSMIAFYFVVEIIGSRLLIWLMPLIIIFPFSVIILKSNEKLKKQDLMRLVFSHAILINFIAISVFYILHSFIFKNSFNEYSLSPWNSFWVGVFSLFKSLLIPNFCAVVISISLQLIMNKTLDSENILDVLE